MLAKEFKGAWKIHLEELGRGADFSGCEYLLSKFRPHVIFVWSAAGCRVPIRDTRSGSGIEPTVQAFWQAASPSLAELLSHWLRLGDAERQAYTGPEMARKAVANIRATWPGWPNLDDDDSTRLTRYVITEDGLQSAWLAAGALPPAALIVPRKNAASYHLSCAVRYAVQLSAVEGAVNHNKPKTTDCVAAMYKTMDSDRGGVSLGYREGDGIHLSE